MKKRIVEKAIDDIVDAFDAAMKDLQEAKSEIRELQRTIAELEELLRGNF